MAFKLYNEEVYMGSERPWSGVQCFFIDPSDELVRVQRLDIGNQGNPGQLMFRRAGPDGVNTADGFVRPESLPPGTNAGHIAWMPYEAADGTFSQRIAQLYVRYRGYGAGSMHFQTSGVERFVIQADGVFSFPECIDRIPVTNANGRRGYIPIVF